jgi:hypothetical protein
MTCRLFTFCIPYPKYFTQTNSAKTLDPLFTVGQWAMCVNYCERFELLTWKIVSLMTALQAKTCS